jgi:hypothetical protein
MIIAKKYIFIDKKFEIIEQNHYICYERIANSCILVIFHSRLHVFDREENNELCSRSSTLLFTQAELQGETTMLKLSLHIALLVLSVVSFSTSMAQEKTWSFTWNKSRSAGGEGFYDLKSHKNTQTTTLNKLTWTITSDSYYYAFTGNTGQLIGGGSVPASWVSLYTTDIAGKVKWVEVESRRYPDDAIVAQLGVEVNGNPYQSSGSAQVTLTGSYVKYKFVPQAVAQEGKIDIKLAQTSAMKKALYLKSITIVYEETSSAVTAPTISLPSGTYDQAQQVVLSSGYGAGEATIFYTLDGTNPKLDDGSRKQYQAAIEVKQSCKLRAVTLKNGEYSTIVDANYVIRQPAGLYWDVQEFEMEAGDNSYGPFLNNPNNVSPIRFKSSNEKVAVVGDNGALFSIKAGTSLIAAIFKGDATFLPDTAWYMLNVKAKEPLMPVTMTPAGGTFPAPVTVTLTATGKAKTIWYSTTANSVDELLDKPVIVAGQTATVVIDHTCTLRAVAVDYNNVSVETVAHFVIEDPSAVTTVNAANLQQRRVVYTLDGRRVFTPTASGVYIVDGTKIYIP